MQDDFPRTRLQLAALIAISIPIYVFRGAMMLIAGPRRWRRVEERIDASGGSTN